MTHAPIDRSLQALILDKKGDRSYERVSRDCGGVPATKALHRLATSPMKAFPDKATLLGLQRGLPASVDQLLDACAISMGLKDDAEHPDNLVIRGAGGLPSSSQQLLIALSAEMQRLAQERDGDAEAASIARAGESPAVAQERRERPDKESSPPAASTSSRETEKRSVDMGEFSARRQRIIRLEAEVDVEPDAEIEAPLGAVARRNPKAKKEAGDDWENV